MLVSSCNTGIEVFGWKKTLNLYRKAGFEAMDFQFCHWREFAEDPVKVEEFLAKANGIYDKIKKEADRIGLVIGQTHAPFPTQKVGDDAFNENMFKLVVKSIELTAILKAPYIVMHSIIPPDRLYDDNREECKKLNMEFYIRIIPYLKKYKVKIAVENLWIRDKFHTVKKIIPTVCATPEEMIEYIEEINKMAGKKIAVACLDIGHSELMGYQPWEVIKKLGKYLKVVHVHDVTYNDDTHTLPLFGQVNWDRTVKALKEIKYDGTFSFEVQKPMSMVPQELYPDVMKLLSSIGHYFVNKYEL